MVMNQIHLEIAKERFLEIMAENPNADVRSAAVAAIEQADDFASAYEALKPAEPMQSAKLKGCRACFGSGGKAGNPCKVCHGSGKVEAA